MDIQDSQNSKYYTLNLDNVLQMLLCFWNGDKETKIDKINNQIFNKNLTKQINKNWFYHFYSKHSGSKIRRIISNIHPICISPKLQKTLSLPGMCFPKHEILTNSWPLAVKSPALCKTVCSLPPPLKETPNTDRRERPIYQSKHTEISFRALINLGID